LLQVQEVVIQTKTIMQSAYTSTIDWSTKYRMAWL